MGYFQQLIVYQMKNETKLGQYKAYSNQLISMLKIIINHIKIEIISQVY